MNILKPFIKHSTFRTQQERPYNAGPALGLLCHSFITSRELFFIRNHGSVPDIDPARYRLSITGLVKKTLHLSLRDLMKLPRVTLTATLQCAGNRRQEFTAINPIPDETPWGGEAIGNAVWAGIPLRQVLLAAGVEPKAQHVVFTGDDDIIIDGRKFNYGSSISLHHALQPEVLLAYEMNDDPLTPMHGFPLRVIVPGHIGARSVKWLTNIYVQATPSTNYFQTHAYKLFPPEVQAETVDWSQGVTLGELPVNAVICRPQESQNIPAGRVWIQGYAITGGNRHVERVELSVDGGLTWTPAELQGGRRPWTWRLWQARLELRPGPHQIIVRATDSGANTQPKDIIEVWNFKGYLNNAWHRVNINVCHID